MSNSSPSIASITWFCALEYERLWNFVCKSVASNPKHPLRDKMTTVNYFGFIDYDVLVVDVLEGRNLLLEDDCAASMVVQLDQQKFQTHISHVPVPRAPQWAGCYAVADHSSRAKANEFQVKFADSELLFEMYAFPPLTTQTTASSLFV
jgi:hypothetical protein